MSIRFIGLHSYLSEKAKERRPVNCRLANLIAGLLIAIMTRFDSACCQWTTQPRRFGTSPMQPGSQDFKTIVSYRLKKSWRNFLRVKGKRTIENTLRPYDEIQTYLDAIKGESNLIAAVHPEASLRSAAEKSRQKAEVFSSSLNLNRRLYEALGTIDATSADAETRYYLERTLQTFRLAGVEETPQLQEKIKALREELIRLGQDFSRNIQSDERTIEVSDVSELQGLPQDFIRRNQPDSNGKIRLIVNSPNVFSVYSYATNDNLRRRMYVQYNSRGYPKNMAVLDELVRKRHELATLLGFASWADYITADKMVKSAASAAASWIG